MNCFRYFLTINEIKSIMGRGNKMEVSYHGEVIVVYG